MEDDIFKFVDEESEFSYKYVMARVANTIDELTDLSSYLQESNFVIDLGIDKFKECSTEIESVKEKVENLYSVIIKTYLNNKLMAPIE